MREHTDDRKIGALPLDMGLLSQRRLAECVAAEGQTRVLIGDALVDEKEAIGEGCLPRLPHQFKLDQAPLALDQRRFVAELIGHLAALERADGKPRSGPPRHDCQPEAGIVSRWADVAGP
jgi:hypothetical protein